MTETEVEEMVQEKELEAPRLTPKDIDNTIESVSYHVFEGTTVTICLIQLTNGFTVTGESACASLENFDEEIGQRIAYEEARGKIWQLEGYLLKEKIHYGLYDPD